MNSTDASSPSSSGSAQDFEPALETRAESEVDVGGEVEVDDDDDDDDESESGQPGKFTGSFRFLLTINSAYSRPARPPNRHNECSGRPPFGPESCASFRPCFEHSKAFKYRGILGSAYGPGKCKSVLPLSKRGWSLGFVYFGRGGFQW